MPNYTPSSSAVERSLLYPLETSIVCLSCGDTMKRLRRMPALGVRSERFIFVCPSCKGVGTKELTWVA